MPTSKEYNFLERYGEGFEFSLHNFVDGKSHTKLKKLFKQEIQINSGNISKISSHMKQFQIEFTEKGEDIFIKRIEVLKYFFVVAISKFFQSKTDIIEILNNFTDKYLNQEKIGGNNLFYFLVMNVLGEIQVNIYLNGKIPIIQTLPQFIFNQEFFNIKDDFIVLNFNKIVWNVFGKDERKINNKILPLNDKELRIFTELKIGPYKKDKMEIFFDKDMEPYEVICKGKNYNLDSINAILKEIKGSPDIGFKYHEEKPKYVKINDHRIILDESSGKKKRKR